MIGNAVLIGRIATGEVEDAISAESQAATLGRKGGKPGQNFLSIRNIVKLIDEYEERRKKAA